MKNSKTIWDFFESENIDANLTPHPTPNCSICQWKVTGELIPAIVGRSIRESSQCSAQGDRYIKRMYGNKICKRLFQTEKSPIKETK